MSGPKWTPAQQAAIADRGGALLVSAAAGSGKTAVAAGVIHAMVRNGWQAHRHLYQRGGGRAAGPHRAGAAAPQPAAARQCHAAPSADAAAACAYLHH